MSCEHFDELVELRLPAKLFRRSVGIAFDVGMLLIKPLGNSADKLRHPRSVAYSLELVLTNKHQFSGGGAYLHCKYFPKQE